MTDAPLDPNGEVQRARLHRRILLDYGRIALNDMDVSALLQRAAAQAGRGMGVQHSKILRFRPDEGDLLVEAGVGWNPGVVGRTRLAADVSSPAGYTLQSGKSLVVDDIRGSPEFRLPDVLADHGIVCLANVPISYDSTVWGVLEVDSDMPREFNEGEVEFLEALACMIAGGLQHAQAVARTNATAAAAAVQSSQREMLLREIQHRVKNNLQVIVSILAQERRAMLNVAPQAAERFGRVMERVAAIGIAHDRLSSSDIGTTDASGSETDLAGYLRALCSSLELSLGGQVTIETDLHPCSLTFDRAVVLGLIVNELATNAAKHAYPDREHGPVRVTLRADAERAEAVVTVADEGRGMGERVPRSKGIGQGLGLVDLLSRQLGGEIVHATPAGGGASVTVRFAMLTGMGGMAG